MVDNRVQRLEANFSKSNICMPVFRSSNWIFAVIDMKDCDLVFPKYLIKTFYDTVKVMDNIITTVMNMTGVETYS